MIVTRTLLAGAVSALLVGTPATGHAQDAAPGAPLGTAEAAIADRAAVDSFVALVPARSPELIDADFEAAAVAERQAAKRRSLADEARRRTRDSLDAQARELDRARDGIRIAGEMDQENRKRALEREARLRERYRDLLSTRIDVLGQEVVTAEQEARHARALADRYRAERGLAEDRLEWQRLHGEAAVTADAEKRRADQEERLQERLKRYFEALRDEKREREKLAAERRELAAQQLRVLERRRHLFDD
jgi:hypothetical protein